MTELRNSLINIARALARRQQGAQKSMRTSYPLGAANRSSILVHVCVYVCLVFVPLPWLLFWISEVFFFNFLHGNAIRDEWKLLQIVSTVPIILGKLENGQTSLIRKKNLEKAIRLGDALLLTMDIIIASFDSISEVDMVKKCLKKIIQKISFRTTPWPCTCTSIGGTSDSHFKATIFPRSHWAASLRSKFFSGEFYSDTVFSGIFGFRTHFWRTTSILFCTKLPSRTKCWGSAPTERSLMGWGGS